MSSTALLDGSLAVSLVGKLAGSLSRDVDVLGLDASGTMRFVTERRRRQDAAAAEELLAVTHWADLHRVAYVGAVDADIARTLDKDATALGMEGELRLAGQGAYGVCEFAVTELAAGLGMSEAAGRAYVGQALELRDRLPRCWDRVVAGDLPAWKGRQVAEQTIPLTADAAGWIDAQLAPFAHRISLGRVLKAVEAAILRFDPEEAGRRAAAAAEHRGVWLHDQLEGTTRIEAVTGTPDAHAFDLALNEVAATLAELGDAGSQQVRRAKAVGVLADPQYALDLVSTAQFVGDGARPRQLPRRTSPGGTTLHIHLHTAAVDALPAAGGPHPVELPARVAGPGVKAGGRSTAAVEQWLADLAPGATVKLTPVVDLSEHISVDAYEVPDRLRQQVEEREHTCGFPWCGRTGVFDVDHIDAYRFHGPDDPAGRPPPGQTSSSNLARLCRYHHRVKTHGGWTYTRDHGTVLTWTSPLGRSYAVDETGTRPLT